MNKNLYKTSLALAAILLALSALFAQQAYAGDGLFANFKRFGKHTYAGPFDISKHSRKKAKTKLAGDFAELGQNIQVELIVQDQRAAVPSEAISFDPDETLAQAVSGGDNPLIAKVSQDGLRTVLSQNFKKLTFTQPQVETIAAQIETQLQSGIMPQYINLADYVPELYEQSETLASASYSAKALTKGLRLVLEDLNGYTIEPNEVFSLREFVNDKPSIAASDEEMTIAASLLYKNALQTNWTIDERNIANELTEGVEPGFEAAVNSRLNLDFVFSNLNKTAFTLHAAQDGQTATLSVEGLPFVRSYEPEVERLNGYDPKKVVRYSAFVSSGKTELADSGKKGLEVTVGRKILLNGSLENYEEISNDFYPPQASIERHGLVEKDSPSNNAGSSSTDEPGANNSSGSDSGTSGSNSSGGQQGNNSSNSNSSNGSDSNSGKNSSGSSNNGTNNNSNNNSNGNSNSNSNSSSNKPDGEKYGYDKGGNVVELDENGIPVD